VGDSEWCLGALTAKGRTVSVDAGCATPDAASTHVVTAEKAEPLGKKLRRAISTRRKWGFETDPEVVREIMRDPFQPSSSEHGFPMTEAEQQDLYRRSGLAGQASGIERWLRREAIYGGMWQDQRASGIIVIALTEADPAVIARIDLEFLAHGASRTASPRGGS
jgi:hypothetical protein